MSHLGVLPTASIYNAPRVGHVDRPLLGRPARRKKFKRLASTKHHRGPR